jgi:hypothetical protein
VTADRTLIRRYVLALTPTGAGNEAAVTAASVPPLRGGPGEHGSEAGHAFTIPAASAGPVASALRAGHRRWAGDSSSLRLGRLPPTRPQALATATDSTRRRRRRSLSRPTAGPPPV